MASLVNGPILALLALAVSAAALSAQQDMVGVTVYFESYCPDSVKFLTKQLYPAYLSPLKDFMNLTLVPYGKAETLKDGDDYEFTCHHGPKECVGNKVLACILMDTAYPLSERLRFVNCTSSMIAANTKLEVYPVKQCETINMKEHEINECASGTEGNQHLAEYGNKTNELLPKLSSVPTIVFNGKFMESESKMAQSNFRMALCSKITGSKPAVCTQNSATTVHTVFLPIIAAIFSVLRA